MDIAQEIPDMTGRKATDGFDPAPDHLEAYLDLTPAEIGRIVLWLLIEEELGGHLAIYRLETGREERDEDLRRRA
jgi:hypothetical protein